MATAVEFSVIGVDKASGTFDDVAASADRASEKIQQSSRDAAQSFEGVNEGAGTLASLGAQAGGALAGLGDTIGGPFGAAMQGAGGAMMFAADGGDLLEAAMTGGRKAVDWLKKTTLGKIVIDTALAAKTAIVTAAQWAWNAAMSANPIGLIVLGIVALIAIIVVLVKNWDKVKAAGAAAWNWIKGVWKSASTWMNNNVIQPIAGFFSGLWDDVKNVWNGASSFFSGIGDGIKGAFRGAFNGVASLWNSTVGKLSWSVPGWVPLIGGSTLSVPNIPMLATGGSIARGGWAVVGERGPEVVSLPSGARVHPNGTGPSGPTINVYPQPGQSEEAIGASAARRLAFLGA